MSQADEVVIATTDGSIRTLTLNRPSRLNAFTARSYRVLAQLLNDAGNDLAVRVVLLRGAGRAFSSGVDLDSLVGSSGALNELRETFDELIEELLSLDKPLVAAVQGPAIGFGATILLHCDVVLVADDARVRFPFTSLRTAPEAGSSILLPSIVGQQNAADLLFTSRWIEPAEAVAMGLALRRCPRDRLDIEARDLARDLAEQEPAAVACAKRLMRAGQAEAVRAAMERERSEARSLAAELGPIRRSDRSDSPPA